MNEKVDKLAFILICGLFLFFVACGVIQSIVDAHRSDREQLERVAELEQRLKEQQRTAVEHSLRAERIAETMGAILERDTDTISDSLQAIEELRAQIKLLESLYTDISGGVNYSPSDNSPASP